MTILVDEQIPSLAERLSDVGDTLTFVGRDLTRERLLEAEADILLVRSTTTVDEELLHGTSVRFVGSATAGINHVDTQWLAEHNIELAYAPGSNAAAVVQYVLAVINQLRSFEGLTLGIIGYGHVGSRLAAAAEQHGLSVLVNDPPLLQAGTLSREHTDLSVLLRHADIVSLHVPLTHEGEHPTFHLMDRDQLSLITPGSLLINTARGGVIAESVIPDGIDLVLDVFENEPHLNRSSVERALIVTPHIAGYTLNAKQQGALMIEAALRNFTLPSRESRGVPPQVAGRGFKGQRAQSIAYKATSAEQRALHPDPRRLDSNLKEAWLADPTPETFDRCRRSYVLV